MVKALVTGGTGFVGSHVVRTLLDGGHTVRVLHRTTSKLDALAGLTYESALGDVLEEEALRAACTGCDWVFHVAAVADYWQADQSHLFAINVEGTRRVLRAAREAGVRRVIFTSSAAAVGFGEDRQPADETIDFSLSPHEFPYGYSKLKAEEVARYAVREYGQDIVTVNPVIVLGPGDLNLISGRFITEMQRLQWTIPVSSGGIGVVDVRDVARWHVLAAERGRTGERYILGTANYSLRDWYALCAQVVGVAAPFLTLPDFVLPYAASTIEALQKAGIQLPVDASQTRLGSRKIHFDSHKTHRELGPPQFDMYTSLEDTYTWYRDHGYLHDDALARFIAVLGRWLGVPGSDPKRRPAPEHT
ncbi:MAG: NAD-dependent epimerase/dehydratase family protein [Anaerolineae bacterium]|nr:NAD-dependent epimerase/dehydratase family protein [Anaerolineae bacterium]